MKEFLQGRSLGYALRPGAAHLAVGVALAALVLDLMSWFQWGARDTHALVVGSSWLVTIAAVATTLSVLTALAERADAPEEDRRLADLDLAAAGAALLLLIISLVVRAGAQGAAAAPPLALLLSAGALVVLIADSAIAPGLYAAREWLDPDEEIIERRPRRTAAR